MDRKFQAVRMGWKLDHLGSLLALLSPQLNLVSTLAQPFHSFRLSWWLEWLRICLQCRRHGFDPWVRKWLHPLQCSCLENPMDSGAWWATVLRVAKTRTGTEQHFLSFFLELFSLSSPVGYWTSICLEAYLSVSYLFAFSSCSWGS